MYFELKFNVWLTWTDDRVGFQNLNKHYFQNEISESVAKKLWIPPLRFENNHQRTYLVYHPHHTSIMLERNGASSMAPLTQLDEAKVYNSNETKIFSRTFKYLKFTCHFDMTYFPFDSQTCAVQVSKTMLELGKLI